MNPNRSDPHRTQSPGEPLHGYQLEGNPNRTHSSGRPFRGYQLEDNRYQQYGHLEMPSSDRLADQPTYSVENIQNSYGHNEAYETANPYRASPLARTEYTISPEAHHDAYYTQPYQPTAPSPSEYDVQPFPSQTPQPYHDDEVPILQNPYRPNPQLNPQLAYQESALAPTPSPAPIRRWKTVKEVQLFNGNLVLDCPIPPRLLSQVNHAKPPERDEFTHMRYSAATCDPADFYNERFTLRQRLFAKPRHTELFIVVTMYNEDDFLFARTMIGVFENIEYMCSRTNSKTWGKEAWKKIVVCVFRGV
ncbi:uncharacterized protein PADG_06480 [Paracoccidioides brasiliensis Pb18]|uniref:Chitin synthase n=1 Tax=Paracoccidioides brasiliensis (strain Pb18) TaxID=502780 RepID=C1GGP3_PARBD|nr:uncharacterized protein PADG_06480 [Paracoccidioides brasiliensis Pb18]EEH50401.2 hypothetical protein PADG_06480 [Paracoccidioides brasiliensis Pb18]